MMRQGSYRLSEVNESNERERNKEGKEDIRTKKEARSKEKGKLNYHIITSQSEHAEDVVFVKPVL
jgi:hypothetical protein